MLAELALAYGELDRDPDLRVGVVFAHGEHFTAGLDLADVGPAMAATGSPSNDPIYVEGQTLEELVGGLSCLSLIPCSFADRECDHEQSWVCWRFHTLETRMESPTNPHRFNPSKNGSTSRAEKKLHRDFKEDSIGVYEQHFAHIQRCLTFNHQDLFGSDTTITRSH